MGIGKVYTIGLIIGIIFVIISMIIGSFTGQVNPIESMPDYSDDDSSQDEGTVDYQVGMTDKQIAMKDYDGDGKSDESSDSSN